MKMQEQVHQKQNHNEEELGDTEVTMVSDRDFSIEITVNKTKSVSEIFKERCEKAKNAQKKNLPVQDQVEYNNPQALSELSQEIFENMKKDEVSKMIPVDYLSRV